MTSKVKISTEHVVDGKYVRVEQIQYPEGVLAAGGFGKTTQTLKLKSGDSAELYIYGNTFINVSELSEDPEYDL